VVAEARYPIGDGTRISERQRRHGSYIGVDDDEVYL